MNELRKFLVGIIGTVLITAIIASATSGLMIWRSNAVQELQIARLEAQVDKLKEATDALMIAVRVMESRNTSIKASKH